MGIDSHTRASVLFAWGNRCFYCGKTACEVDHVIPLSKGGRNDPRNLVAACRICNQSKRNLWLPKMVLEEALEAAAILAPFVQHAVKVSATASVIAAERVIYGSLPLRSGTKGQAHVSTGQRHLEAARDIAKWGASLRDKYMPDELDRNT